MARLNVYNANARHYGHRTCGFGEAPISKSCTFRDKGDTIYTHKCLTKGWANSENSWYDDGSGHGEKDPQGKDVASGLCRGYDNGPHP